MGRRPSYIPHYDPTTDRNYGVQDIWSRRGYHPSYPHGLGPRHGFNTPDPRQYETGGHYIPQHPIPRNYPINYPAREHNYQGSSTTRNYNLDSIHPVTDPRDIHINYLNQLLSATDLSYIDLEKRLIDNGRSIDEVINSIAQGTNIDNIVKFLKSKAVKVTSTTPKNQFQKPDTTIFEDRNESSTLRPSNKRKKESKKKQSKKTKDRKKNKDKKASDNSDNNDSGFFNGFSYFTDILPLDTSLNSTTTSTTTQTPPTTTTEYYGFFSIFDSSSSKSSTEKNEKQFVTDNSMSPDYDQENDDDEDYYEELTTVSPPRKRRPHYKHKDAASVFAFPTGKDYDVKHKNSVSNISTKVKVSPEGYVFPLKLIIVVSSLLGTLAAFTVIVLIAYTIVKCKKKPSISNYKISGQKPLSSSVF